MTFKCKEIRSGPSYDSIFRFLPLKSRVLIILFSYLPELVNYIPWLLPKESGSPCFALDRAWAACVIKHSNLRYKNDFGFGGESDRVWPLRDIVHRAHLYTPATKRDFRCSLFDNVHCSIDFSLGSMVKTFLPAKVFLRATTHKDVNLVSNNAACNSVAIIIAKGIR